MHNVGMSVAVFLALMGTILAMGVLGQFFFAKIRIPNPVILMVFGILLGPVFGLVDGDKFHTAAPYFGTIALILILFQGGLEIDLVAAVGQARSAIGLGIVYFMLCVGAVFFVTLFGLKLEPRVALLYGLVLGGTSPAVVLPVLQNLNITTKTKALFSLETVVGEVLTVVCTVLALDFMTSAAKPNFVGASVFIFHSIGTAFVLSALAGWAWNWVMPIIERTGMSQMATLAFLFILYAFTTSIHAEAAVTVLFFGLWLENGHIISDYMSRFASPRVLRLINFPRVNDQKIFSSLVHEITLLIRTYFFFVVGLIFDFTTFSWGTMALALAILFVFYGGRWMSMNLISSLDRSIDKVDFHVGMITMPRGLATAVVALMVQASGLPGTEELVPIAFLSILLTNLLMARLVRSKWGELSN